MQASQQLFLHRSLQCRGCCPLVRLHTYPNFLWEHLLRMYGACLQAAGLMQLDLLEVLAQLPQHADAGKAVLAQ